MYSVMQQGGVFDKLREIRDLLARPPWLDPSDTTLRNKIVSGTVTTVTTVTTLSNQSQIGAVDGKTAFADFVMKQSWAANVRARVS